MIGSRYNNVTEGPKVLDVLADMSAGFTAAEVTVSEFDEVEHRLGQTKREAELNMLLWPPQFVMFHGRDSTVLTLVRFDIEMNGLDTFDCHMMCVGSRTHCISNMRKEITTNP